MPNSLLVYPGPSLLATIEMVPDETYRGPLTLLFVCIFGAAICYSVIFFWGCCTKWINSKKPGGSPKDREGLWVKMLIIAPMIFAAGPLAELVVSIGWWFARHS